MHIILPANSLATELCETTRFWTASNGLSPISMEQSHLIVKAAVESILFSKLKWCEQYLTPEEAVKNIEWYRDIDSDNPLLIKLSTDFWFRIVLVIMERLERILNNEIKFKTEDDYWRIWYVLPIRNDLLIERGRDFRIMEYERLVSQNKVNGNE